MKIPNFKMYPGVNSVGTQYVSLKSSKELGLSKELIEVHQISQYNFAHILYDPETKALGIIFHAGPAKPNSLKITFDRRKNTIKGAKISIGNVLNYYHIDYLQYLGRYRPEKINYPGLGEIFTIYLKTQSK